jgi:hypothetical protein
VQREVEDATNDFLHRIARASRAEALSVQSYEALVHSLDQKRRDVVARVLASLPPPPPPPAEADPKNL